MLQSGVSREVSGRGDLFCLARLIWRAPQVEEQQRSLRAWREKLEISDPSFNRLGVDEYSLGRHCVLIIIHSAPPTPKYTFDFTTRLTSDESVCHLSVATIHMS
jgi:hypothetical protein